MYMHINTKIHMVGWLFGSYGISTFVGYSMPNLFKDIYMVHSISFQTFFVQAFKIVIDS